MADNEKKDVAEVAETEAAAEVKADVKAVKADDKKSEKKPKGQFKEKVSRFLRDYKSELKKIVWYGREATVKSTGIVVAFILVSAVFIGILDFAFSKGIAWLGGLI